MFNLDLLSVWFALAGLAVLFLSWVWIEARAEVKARRFERQEAARFAAARVNRYVRSF